MRVKATTNPFRPTFGASPRQWAGRRTILDDFSAALNGGPGEPHRSMVIRGSRGIGKTVLLTELEELARREGWIVLRASGRPDTVETLIKSSIPQAIREISDPPRRVVTGLGIAGVGRLETEIVDHFEPVPTLGIMMRELLGRISTGVLITVDEVQDADPEALASLAASYQDLVRDDADVALIMAGLSEGVSQLLDLPGTTFLRRARRYELGPLVEEDVKALLIGTAAEADTGFDVDAAERACEIAQGYPYLVQLVGYLAFKRAEGTITRAEVEAVSGEAIETMGAQVHHPSLKGVPDAQMNYLLAMSDCEEDAVSTSRIADKLGKSPNATTDTRSKLLERGLIERAGWGKVAFALPYLKEFLRGGGRVLKVN